MKFAIAGAGAVGAYLGARMSRAGLDVTLLARGAALAAIARDGVRVLGEAGGDWEARPAVAGDAADIGPVDAVLLAVKAHALPSLAPRLAPLVGPETAVVSLQNGIPWWYFPDVRLESVDPGGAVSAAIERRRVVGGIVYFATETAAPGVVRHVEGNRLSIGEPEGGRTERCRSIAQALTSAGLRAPVTAHIRDEIWVKLLGNMTFNPVSALTGATMAGILRTPATRTLVRGMMAEAEALGTKLGIPLLVSVEQRLAGAEKVGEHKTSMLQDLEAGRPLELEALVGAPLEVAARVGVPMPCTEAVYACTKLRAASVAGHVNHGGVAPG
jgi:2-dehydropantoate 2-reductase